MTRTRWIWMLSVAAALALGIVAGSRWFAASPTRMAQPQPAQPQPSPASAERPEQQPFLEIEGTNLSGTDESGRRIWDLRAETLRIDNARRRITLTSVSGQFYRAGRPEMVFRAARALFDVASRDVELSGGVVARAKDGRVLRAPRMRWDASRKTLEATGGVAVTQKGMSIHADTVAADAALEETRFAGNILVRVTE